MKRKWISVVLAVALVALAFGALPAPRRVGRDMHLTGKRRLVIRKYMGNGMQWRRR